MGTKGNIAFFIDVPKKKRKESNRIREKFSSGSEKDSIPNPTSFNKYFISLEETDRIIKGLF